MATEFRTVLRNTSAGSRHFAWWPYHGATFAAGEEKQFDGDLTAFVTTRARNNKRLLEAFQADLESGAATITRFPARHRNIGTHGEGIAWSIEDGNPVFHRTGLRVSALNVPITDTGGANGGYGSQELYTFPNGLIQIVGAVTDFTIEAASGIVATATVKHAIGTAAEETNHTLDATQANILASSDSVLVASAGAAKGLSSSSLGLVNGVTNPVKAFLNFGIADAGISASSSVTITGWIWLTWVFLGRN